MGLLDKLKDIFSEVHRTGEANDDAPASDKIDQAGDVAADDGPGATPLKGFAGGKGRPKYED